MTALFPSDNIRNTALLWETWSGIWGSPLKENSFPGVGGDITFQTSPNIRTNPAEPVNHRAKSMPQDGGFTLSHPREGKNNYPFNELAKAWALLSMTLAKKMSKTAFSSKVSATKNFPQPSQGGCPLFQKEKAARMTALSRFHLSISGMLAVATPFGKARSFG